MVETIFPVRRRGFLGRLFARFTNYGAFRIEVGKGEPYTSSIDWIIECLVDPNERQRIKTALDQFVEQLRSIDGVEAIAFLQYWSRPAPRSLLMETFVPLSYPPADEDKEIYLRVVDAEGNLFKSTHPALLSNMIFVNTRETDLKDLEQKAKERWVEDSTLHLLAFLIFRH